VSNPELLLEDPVDEQESVLISRRTKAIPGLVYHWLMRTARTRRAAWTVVGAVFFGCSGRTALDASTNIGSALFVQGVLASQLIAPGQMCVYTADPTQPMLSSGVLDVAFRDEYTPTLLVGNQPLVAGDASEQPDDAAELQGASIQVTDASGSDIDAFDTVVAGFVYGPSSGVPGYSPLAVTLLDSGAVAAVRDRVTRTAEAHVIAHVTVRGVTRGGAPVQSDDFVFPIDVCEGCLVAFAPGDMDPAFPEPNCLASTASGAGPGGAALPMPCVRGQDAPVDCSNCQDVPVCHGATAADAGP